MPPLGSRAQCSAQFRPGSDHDLIIFVLSLISGQTLGGSHFSGSCSTPSPSVSDGAGASVGLRRESCGSYKQSLGISDLAAEFDAFRTIARMLVERTRADAE